MSTLFPHDPGPHVPHEDVQIGATYYRRLNGTQALFTVLAKHPRLSFIGMLHSSEPITGPERTEFMDQRSKETHSAIAANLFPVLQVLRRMEVERPTTFDFAQALGLLREGEKVSRLGWNGSGMWVSLIEAREEDSHSILPHLMLKTTDGKFVPWLASQSDLLAEDWIGF